MTILAALRRQNLAPKYFCLLTTIDIIQHIYIGTLYTTSTIIF